MNCFLLALLAAISVGAASQDNPTTAPKRRALIISVDGLRPDVMLRADAPRLRKLIDEGSFTCWAQTTAVAVTLPSHVSMLTGVRPQRHQIEWNYDVPLSQPVYPSVPTIFELAHKAGLRTAMVVAKAKLDALNKPGTLDAVWMPEQGGLADHHVVTHAISIINDLSPDLLFVHFGEVDVVGHGKGWGTPEQLTAIGNVDEAIGQVLDAMKARNLLDSTLVIISADHGGAGKTHGADDVRSRHIPWIAWGPGVKRGFDLTRVSELNIRTEDTFATACEWLRIKLPSKIDGKPVADIFETPKKSAPSSQPSGN